MSAATASGEAVRPAAADPDGRRFRLARVPVEPAGDVVAVVGFDGRLRLLPSGDDPPAGFRPGVRDALVRVKLPSPTDRLADLRGVPAVELDLSAEVRLDGPPAVLAPAPTPLPVTLAVSHWRPLIGGGYRLTVAARYPLAAQLRMMTAPSASTGLSRRTPLLDGPVRVAPADRFGFQVAVTGRAGATAGLAGAGGKRFDTRLGVQATDGQHGTYELTPDQLRLAVGADGVVTQTLTVTVTAREPPPREPADRSRLPEGLRQQMAEVERRLGERPPLGPLARVRFTASLPAELPFHLRDVPVLAGVGGAD